jgi:hypothetical protein
MKKQEDKLTVRELITIRLIQFMIKVLKPNTWADDFEEVDKEINSLLKKAE